MKVDFHAGSMRKSLNIIVILFAALFTCSLSQAEVSRSTLDGRLVRTAESFENVLGSKTGPIPPSILKEAKGIVIFREYGAGFFFGGKGGFGVVMERQHDGRWGAPAFLSAGEGSFGLQVGVQQLDLVFLFMNHDALRIFDQPKFRIGVDAAAAAGPVGANAEAKVGAPILVYTANGGLFAGAAFEGGAMLPDGEANASMYNSPGIMVPQILRGENVKFPPAADSIRHELEDYESGHYRP